MRPVKFDKCNIVLISWEDIVSNPLWLSGKKLEKATTTSIKTVGFFLDTIKKNHIRILRIAHSIGEDGESDIMTIPWGAIENIKIINLEEKIKFKKETRG